MLQFRQFLKNKQEAYYGADPRLSHAEGLELV